MGLWMYEAHFYNMNVRQGNLSDDPVRRPLISFVYTKCCEATCFSGDVCMSVFFIEALKRERRWLLL